MILIEEIIPKKVSGRTSLLVSFKYNQGIVEAIKTVPNALYHKKDYTWEIPISSLSFLLDTLTPLDDIELRLITKPDPDENSPTSLETDLTETEISQFRIRPFDHQIEAINYGLAHPRWLLLDGMGIGKTNEIIWLAETLHRRGLIDHCFIVCGVNSVKQNWKKEIAKFSTESCRILGEKITRTGTVRYATLPDRAEELKKEIEAFFLITNIETLRDDKIIEAFNKSKNSFGMIAVDEIHRVATKASQQGSNLLKLKSEYKVGATGTLITNNPLSCYVPLAWTGNDHATLTQYKSQYCNFGGFNGYQIIGSKNLDLLRDEIEHCSVRRTLDQVRDSIPPKQVDFEIVELNEDHKKFYEAIKTGVKEEADKIKLNANNLLALTTRLRQATADPMILTSNTVSATKIERAAELIEDIVAQGEKVVVLSNFKDPINRLARLVADFNPLINTGDIKDEIISANVDKFQNDPTCKVFLGTHAKVGTGLTLNASMYMIMLDTPFTYASFAQSCDRIWRVNNTRPAFIRVLVAKDTIDERVQEILETKKDLSDYLVDGVENESFSNTLRSIIEDL